MSAELHFHETTDSVADRPTRQMDRDLKRKQQNSCWTMGGSLKCHTGGTPFSACCSVSSVKFSLYKGMHVSLADV